MNLDESAARVAASAENLAERSGASTTLDVIEFVNGRRARTLVDVVSIRVHLDPDGVAYFGQQPGSTWFPVKQVWFSRAVNKFAAHLRKLGVSNGVRVGILSLNSVGWEVAQHAAFKCGGTVVGLDVNSPVETLESLLEATSTKLLCVDRGSRMSAFSDGGREALEHVVHLDHLMAQFADEHGASVFREDEPASSFDRVSPDDPALIVFSSGTTGTPKAIEYSHRQVITAMSQVLNAFRETSVGAPLVCWLPLANLFQRMINFCGLARGDPIYIVGRPQDVVSACAIANPEILIGVPRFFERVRAETLAALRTRSLPIRILTQWALRRLMEEGNQTADSESIQVRANVARRLADALVGAKLRALFGKRIRFLVSGSAALSSAVHTYYRSIGLPIYEAYGLSECVVPVAMNSPGERREGSVGRPMLANSVRISDEGEVLVGGPGVFGGYLTGNSRTSRPDVDGFWHTGDLGYLDSEGYLWISGRKSDEFKLSTGRWVSPPSVEAKLRSIPMVEHALVVGKGRKIPVALLSIPQLSKGAQSDANQGRRPNSADAICDEVLRCTAELPAYVRPGGLLVLIQPFTIEGGELTTNLKIRRTYIEHKYREEIDHLYRKIETDSGAGQAFPISERRPIVAYAP